VSRTLLLLTSNINPSLFSGDRGHSAPKSLLLYSARSIPRHPKIMAECVHVVDGRPEAKRLGLAVVF
jgi:hypothetical protein